MFILNLKFAHLSYSHFALYHIMEHFTKFVESVHIPQRIDREKLMPIVSIAAATTVLFASYKLISSSNHKKRMREQGFKEIPVPGSCYPYVGHMFSMGELPGKAVSEWHRELGPIIKIKMGCQDWYTIGKCYSTVQYSIVIMLNCLY